MGNENLVPHGSWYTLKKNGNEINLTGYDPSQAIDVNWDVLIGSDTPKVYKIVEIERRDHLGNFKDEANRINSFYSAKAVLYESGNN